MSILRIVGAGWTREVNVLVILCDCGAEFSHRADRWRVRCACGATGTLDVLREDYRQRWARRSRQVSS